MTFRHFYAILLHVFKAIFGWKWAVFRQKSFIFRWKSTSSLSNRRKIRKWHGKLPLPSIFEANSIPVILKILSISIHKNEFRKYSQNARDFPENSQKRSRLSKNLYAYTVLLRSKLTGVITPPALNIKNRRRRTQPWRCKWLPSELCCWLHSDFLRKWFEKR